MVWNDGACALHAIFGVPQIHVQWLQAINVRRRVLDSMPEEYAVLVESLNPTLSTCFKDMLDAVWAEAKEAAS